MIFNYTEISGFIKQFQIMFLRADDSLFRRAFADNGRKSSFAYETEIRPNEMFKKVLNEKLDKIRIAEVWGTSDFFYVRGEAASAYHADLNLKKFDRHFLHVATDYFVVWDELETEKPANFTFLLNADREIKTNQAEADLINKDAALRVARVLPSAAISFCLKF